LQVVHDERDRRGALMPLDDLPEQPRGLQDVPRRRSVVGDGRPLSQKLEPLVLGAFLPERAKGTEARQPGLRHTQERALAVSGFALDREHRRDPRLCRRDGGVQCLQRRAGPAHRSPALSGTVHFDQVTPPRWRRN
jgi:hypothetical protein